MVILKRALGIFGLVLMCSCTSTTRMMMTAELPSNQTNYKKIYTYFQEPPRRSRPIALIAVARDGENALWAVEILKMEAAAVGADAIAHLEINYTTGMFPTLRVQGLAVKYVR
ncbi:MAG: hypothetical protein M9962_10820 [Oligoflexia bacterium]|nr:hypothetical protein [Oligoflexia bacterium]